MEGPKAQSVTIPYVDDTLCKACRKCVARAVCRSKAIIVLDPGEPPFIDASRCYGCQLCVTECPFGAIQVPKPRETITVGRVLKK